MKPVARLPPIDRRPPERCHLCGAASPSLLGEKDFSHTANDHFAGVRQFEDSGVAIPYHHCRGCGLVFTTALDSWSAEDFKRHIYNDDYALCDPPFAEERPCRNAAIIAGIWHYETATCRILDFGGGSGRLAAELCARGFAAESYDVFYSSSPLPTARFPLVCSFEVIEHVPHRDQASWIAAFVGLIEDRGVGLLGTRLLEEPVELAHFYLSPRNGHVTVHSSQSLARLLAPHGLIATSLSRDLHVITPRRHSA
ncbi:MAG TPA: class I SAM-dependent methyltransferase [Pseudomonadota bacterium]|nr:class I SAM-dependent methyltransferase [Pseudomonadota bacterium]